jgi:hypothetical protein
VDGRKLDECPGYVFTALQKYFAAYVRDKTSGRTVAVVEQ